METRRLLTGDHAVAYGALLARPEIIAVSRVPARMPLLEMLRELRERGELTGDLMSVESEHAALTACIAGSLAGARVFTARTSRGRALEPELPHDAAVVRAPIVMVDVDRTEPTPYGRGAGHADSLAQRDTGWLQFFCESAQEALDTVLQAYRVAESVRLPARVVIGAADAHTLEPVDVPDVEVVARFLPPFRPERPADPAAARASGGTATPAQWRANRAAMHRAMARALQSVSETGRAWGELTGRAWAPLQTYRTEDAGLALIVAGGLAGAARQAIDGLRDDGVPIGLVRVRIFRPFPADPLVEAMAGFDKVAIIDRDCSIGSGGIVAQEVRAALNARALVGPRIFSYVAGLGGAEVPPERVARIALDLRRRWAPYPETILEEEL